jgi:CBS domain containing-hemolysin-like protein
LIDLVSLAIRRLLRGGAELPGNVMHPRRVVTHLIREGVGHGVISAYQSEMIDRVLQLGRLRARDVMKPFEETTAVRVNQPPEAVWAIADRAPYARLPLLETDGWPIGIINVYDVLIREPEKCPSLRDLAHPLPRIAPHVSCRSALLALQRRRASMGVVIDEGRPLGLVTIKDLVEPIVGELDVW